MKNPKGKDSPEAGWKMRGIQGRVPPKTATSRKKPGHMAKGKGTPKKPRGQAY